MKAYFISGLGCDRRAFQRIRMPEGFDVVHLEWIPPEPQESLHDYSVRLARPIDASLPFILVGLSFGGMAAIEISKVKQPEKLFLISSVTSWKDLPFLYRACGRLFLDRIIPASWLKKPNVFINRFFGPLDKQTKPLFNQILEDTDPVFLKWALGRISRWRNEQVPSCLVRIHSRNDRVFPGQKFRNGYMLSRGGHFCVYTNGPEINRILAKELQTAHSSDAPPGLL